MENKATEWDKMLSGERYEASAREFGERLLAVREAVASYNNLPPSDTEAREKAIKQLLGKVGTNFNILQPFRCDYGSNISIGDFFFSNFNLTILDEARVTIGDHCFIGPNVGIYTACHPLEPDERNRWVEWAEPVTIGNNVWIGGGVTICPGVTIGDNCVIGAGAVVVRDIPDCSVAVGNPALVIKTIDVNKQR